MSTTIDNARRKLYYEQQITIYSVSSKAIIVKEKTI